MGVGKTVVFHNVGEWDRCGGAAVSKKGYGSCPPSEFGIGEMSGPIFRAFRDRYWPWVTLSRFFPAVVAWSPRRSWGLSAALARK